MTRQLCPTAVPAAEQEEETSAGHPAEEFTAGCPVEAEDLARQKLAEQNK